ncbi:hypothetical protein B5807_08743 [Epicoccum nigrum]|uniref:Uncharacterized protein n=1 Tax=Epicoccum nigrum TaxID=105696 RepID=A0A1Y2LSH8_EPING|nr:hypothetical protein B5807_08743 [Epicoccum nigrum]
MSHRLLIIRSGRLLYFCRGAGFCLPKLAFWAVAFEWLVARGLCIHGSRMSISQNKKAKSLHGNMDEQDPRRRWRLKQCDNQDRPRQPQHDHQHRSFDTCVCTQSEKKAKSRYN